MKHSSKLLLSFVFAIFPLIAQAATTEFRVLLDTDMNASTGCSVATPAGPFVGADQILITTVDATSTGATVTSVARQVCAFGTLGAPIAVPAPVPYGVGAAGPISYVESVLPMDVLGTPAPAVMRLAFLASTGASVDSITQTPSAADLMWPKDTGQRRHAVSPVVQPQLITLDGAIQDWGGIPPFVPGSAGGPSAPKFVNVYLYADTANLWFRFDAKLGGTAPVAVDDTYTVRQGKTLNVAAPGVLANDSDPNGATLTPSVVSNPQHGTLALDPSGSFTYVNNGASAPVDTFTYHDTSTTGTSNTANVTINVTPDHKPVANPDNYNVGHGGTLIVPAPGVLINDTDSDGDSLHAILASGPQHGTLALASNGSFTYTHDGSNTLQDTFTYRASDGVLSSSNALVTITIGPVGPAITSANSTQFTAGTFGTFTVTTTGFPPPALSETGALPSGVSFLDNGNGTATLSGTPAGGSGGVYPLVFTATNTGGTANQNFTLTVCNVIAVTNPATTTGVAGAAFSQTFTQTGAVGGATFTTASALPAGLTLSSGGLLSGTPTQTGTFPITVTVTDGNGCTGTGPTYNLTITCQTITVTNPATNTGTAGTAFSQTFTQIGAIGTATFTTASALPAGLTLSTAGLLSGTPTAVGSFPITVIVTDSNGCTGNGGTYTLTIGCPTITVGNPATTTGTAGAAFSQTFTQTGAVNGATFTIASGTLPTGLSLSSAGLLSGTPTVVGSFPITVTVTDGNGCTGTGATYNLVINCQTITVTNPATTTGTVSAPFSQTFTQSGALGGATFTTASTLPTGLSLSTAGLLSGTPTQPGTFPIVVTVTDGNGCTGTSATYTLVIACQVISVGNPNTSSWPAGSPLTAANFTFTQSGAVGGATFTTASTLPTGVTLTTAGVLTGTPAQGGTFPITVTVTDGNGCTGTSSGYSLTIVCPTITVTSPANSTGTAGVAFSEQFTQAGGVGTITWSEIGALPAGITLNPSTGVLSGTTNVAGVFPITVTATDQNGCTGSSSTYNLTINCQTINVTNPGVNTGTVDAAFSQTFTVTGILGTVTWSETGALPAGITLDSSTGVLSGTPTVNGTFPITVKATDTNNCFGTSSYTLTISCQTITVTNPVNTNGTVDVAFSEQFTQTGAHGTATFTTSSLLPAGLTLSSGGLLSGTPTVNGTFGIDVTVTDSNGCTGTNTTYTLVIACPTINVSNPATTSGTVDAAFSQTFTQTGAHGTATFTTASTLPAGITLAANGLLSGTPTVPGTFPIDVTVTDSNGCTGTNTTYTLVIACQTITVTSPANTTGTVSAPFSVTFTQTGGHLPVTFSTISPLPPGLLLATNGVLSGTPTQPGTFPIVVTVTDVNGCTGTSATYTLIISCQVINVGNPNTNSWPAGTPLPAPNFTFTQSGAIGGATFTTASTLPTGVTLTTAGVLTGTPMQGGSFPITVVVTDGNGCTGTSSGYTLTITCPTITVTSPANNTGTAGVAFSEQFTQAGGVGTITWSVTVGSLPSGITLNPSTGVLSGTTNVAGVFPITVTATDQNGCTGSSSTYNLTINCQTITVTNPGVNTGTVNAAFSQTFLVSGILGTVTWSETGPLPAGVTLDSSTGVLSGTPTQPGTFPITVKATDTNLCFGTSSYTLTISCQTITVTNPANNTGTAGVAFSEQFTQASGVGTITWSVTGSLPSGITFNTTNGVLSGTTNVAGIFPITVTATDQNGCQGTGATYNLTINCQTITVTNPAVNTGTVNVPFSQTFTVSGILGTVTWSEIGALPAGITLDPSTGVLSGTPTQPGSFAITVKATDTNLCFGTSSYTLTINCQTITVTNPVNTNATVGVPFSEQFTQTGAIGGATFTTASPLPTGLTLSASGLLSGTPLQSGPFNIVVTVTDGNLCTGTGATYPLVVTCNVINVTNPANASGTAGSAFSEQFTQTGGNGSITWSVNGTLPAGISINTSTGLLSGTTSEVGTFPITVTAVDANGCSGTGATYNLTFTCQTINITNPAQTSVQAGVALNATFTATGILGTATWTETGSLPTGITLSSTGVLSGTTNQVGTFPITVKVTDTNLCFTTSSYTLTVTCPTITVTRSGGGSFPNGTFNTAYAGQSVVAAGGSGTYTYAVTSGSLPTGLSLSSGGAISGTPTATGTFTFVVTATDSSTSCTGASATLSIAIAPACVNDSFSNLVNNTQAVITGGTTTSPTTPFVPLTGVIIGNDLPSGGVAAVAGTVATTQSGSVTIAADGTFIYTPPVTVTALTTDSFTYTISSNTGATGTPTQATGTVTLNLAGRVWYVKNNVANGNGQSQSPFNSTSNFTNGARATPDKPGDIIYIHTGDGTTLNHTSGITLLQNEQLIGQGVALVVNTVTLQAAGTKPLITNTTVTSDAVTLHDGNTIKGLTVTAATRDGIAGSAHAGLTVDTVTIQNNVAAGLHLTTMTGTVTVTNTTFTGNAIGLDVDNGTAAITVDNTNSITANAGQRSVRIQNRPAAAGNITLGTGITDNGTGILVNNNQSGTIAFSGTQTLATTTNTAVALTTNTGATVNFTGTLGITTTTGTGFTATGGGTVGVSGTANITTGAAAAGLNLNAVTSSGVTFNSVTTTGATTGVSLTSLGNGNVTINGGNVNGGTTGYALSTLGTSNITLNNLTIGGVTPPTTAISGTNFGTLTISGTVNVSGVSALNLNTGIVSGTFNNVTSSGGTNGASLTSVSGTWGATAGTLTGATGPTFLVSGAAAAGSAITWGGAISQANGALAVSISGHNRTVTFNGNVTPSGTSTGISLAGNTGTYAFNGTNAVTGTGGGISINTQTGGSVTFSANTSISTTATPSFNVTSSSASITYGGTISQVTAGNKVLNIGTYSTGTLTMNGTALTGSVAAPGGVFSTLNDITGTVVINNLSLTANNNTFVGTLLAISGTNTGGSITFNHLVLQANGNNHTGKGLTMATGGTLTITATGGASSIDVGSTALDLNTVALGASAIGTLNSLGVVTANGVLLTSVTGGPLTIGGGAITGNTASAFKILNGSPSVSYAGTITQNTAGNRAVDITGVTGGTITLSGAIGSNGGTGVFITDAGATINISGNMTLTTGTANAFTATGSGVVNITGATNNITTTSGTGILWNGVTGTSTETFNNVTSTTGPAVSLTSTGATIFTFNDVTSGSGGAFSATTGTGTFTFHAINATGAANGVNVNGSFTGFTVNGTGTTAASGGTIQTCTANGIKIIGTNNITLKNMVLTGNGTAQTVAGSNANCGGNLVGSNNLQCVANLYLQTNTNVTVDRTSITNSGQMGINGNDVTNFNLTLSTVTGNGGTESDEDGILFQNLKGTSSVVDTTVQNNAAKQIYIENGNGTTLTFDLKKQTLGTMNVGYTTSQVALPSSQGLFFSGHGSAVMTLRVDGVTIANNFGDGIASNVLNTSSLNGFIQNCTLSSNNSGINLQNQNTGTIGTNNATPFVIQNNTNTANGLQGINIGTASAATGGVWVKIDTNTIGGATAGSACKLSVITNCDGIDLRRFGPNSYNVTLNNNTIKQFGGAGISLSLDSTGSMAVKITNNQINNVYDDGSATYGNAILSNIAPATGGSACLDISGNTIDGGRPVFGWDPNGSGAAIYTRARNGATVTIPGYAGGDNATNVQNYIAGANTMTAPAAGQKVLADTATGTFANGAGACSTP